eukprot:2921066-Rhodomonas_salina.3
MAARSTPLSAYAPDRRCPPIVLRSRSAMSGTDVAWFAVSPCAVARQGPAMPVILLCARCAMNGTDNVYGSHAICYCALCDGRY